jgi:nucleoid-associated protein YgaU
MGNFEKLGILVIIVLVVVIIVVAAWGVRSDPTTDAPLAASVANDRTSGSGESAPSPDDRDADEIRHRGGESGGRGEEEESGREIEEEPPPPVPPVPAPKPKRYHVVKSGDSPWKLAARYYGKGHLWPKIRKANPGVDFDPLARGKKLLIPYLEEERPAVDSRRETRDVVAGGRTYVIKEGDTLWDIARDELGDATRHPEILEANPDLNEHRLREGTKIRLPAR